MKPINRRKKKRNILPHLTIGFIGRSTDIEKIRTYILNLSSRVITLLGPGGIGKTSLAIACAHQLSDSFSDGVIFHKIDSKIDSYQLILSLSNLFGLVISKNGTPERQLHDYLHSRSVLLLLDGVEESRISVNMVIGKLVANTENVVVLLTSRIRVGLQLEQLLTVNGLSTLTETSVNSSSIPPAIQLFINTAQRTTPDYSPNHYDLNRIVVICNLLGGSPLAIEFASAWLRVLSLEEIEQQIKTDLGMLRDESDTDEKRQKGIESILNRSWNYLTDEERRACLKLSIFRDSCDWDAAKSIAGASKSTLAGLIDKSFLMRTLSGRYYMHALVQRYAENKLSTDASLSDSAYSAHAKYYEKYFNDAFNSLLNNERSLSNALKYKEDFGNLRVFFIWATKIYPSNELSAVIQKITLFYQEISCLIEGEIVLRNIKSKIESSANLDQNILGKILTRHALFCEKLGLFRLANIELRQALAIFRASTDSREYMNCLSLLSLVNLIQGNIADARSQVEEAMQLCSDMPEDDDQIRVLHNLANIVAHQDFKSSEVLYRNISDQYRKSNDAIGVASSLQNIGTVAYKQGKFKYGLACFNEALQLYEKYGRRSDYIWSLNGKGIVLCALGYYKDAIALHRIALEISKETNQQLRIAESLIWLGDALRLDGESLEEALSSYENAYNICSKMSDIYGVALSLNRIGIIKFKEGNFKEGADCQKDALNIFDQIESAEGQAMCLLYLGIMEKVIDRRKAWDYLVRSCHFAQSCGAYPLLLCVCLELAIFGGKKIINNCAKKVIEQVESNSVSEFHIIKNAREIMALWHDSNASINDEENTEIDGVSVEEICKEATKLEIYYFP